jgi:hypothetical protein
MSDDLSTYSIKIDFLKGTPDPARVFDATASYIRAFQGMDDSLLYPFDVPGARSIVLLEDIQTGSLLAKLKTILEGIDDEALKELDWKKAVGAYLVRAKHRMISFIDKRERITDASEVIEIQAEIVEEAEKTEIAYLPHYERPPIAGILADLSMISRASQRLFREDQALLISDLGVQRINTSFSINQEEVEDILTADELVTDTQAILQVKKPDYLGQSMWEFRETEHTIRAKIVHDEFLDSFQRRKADVRPGDALRVLLRTSVRLTADGEEVARRYIILEVFEILHSSPSEQTRFDLEH